MMIFIPDIEEVEHFQDQIRTNAVQTIGVKWQIEPTNRPSEVVIKYPIHRPTPKNMLGVKRSIRVLKKEVMKFLENPDHKKKFLKEVGL